METGSDEQYHRSISCELHVSNTANRHYSMNDQFGCVIRLPVTNIDLTLLARSLQLDEYMLTRGGFHMMLSPFMPYTWDSMSDNELRLLAQRQAIP